ncbi:MAG: DUF1501 domain-containing protein [Roseibacillus sp.]|nr:DUF1501 domain-containing protein [Roseibacillus sp.]
MVRDPRGSTEGNRCPPLGPPVPRKRYGASPLWSTSSLPSGQAHVHDLHATILHLMGLNKKLTYFHSGRNHRLTDLYGKVLREIVA